MNDKPEHLEGRFVCINYIPHIDALIAGSSDGKILLLKSDLSEDKVVINGKEIELPSL